jgi:cysteate synthase
MSYKLLCPACGLVFDDDGFALACPRTHSAALLTTVYASRTFECDPAAAGMYRYRSWLPGANRPPKVGRTVTYQSQQLSSILRLPNLWIAFSGYWPERSAALETGSFKELEVGGVLSRIPKHSGRILVVASAGNTAAAFARMCSEGNIPCLIIVPRSGMGRMRFSSRLNPCVKIVCLTGHAGYSDAIALAERISQEDGFVCEGGVKNVGRRDGMATAMYSAVEAIGGLPEYYFQAIGSGAGAIAAHEAAKRLVKDGRFASSLPHLMLSQNEPFTPIYDSWKTGRRDFVEVEPGAARTLTTGIVATVLSNQRPPYSIAGGVFDVLQESQGDMFAVRNEEVLRAMKLFESCEGIDIDPAAGVALAALTRAARCGQIDPEATVLLHITGGGSAKRARENVLFAAQPYLEIPLAELGTGARLNEAIGLFANTNGEMEQRQLKAVAGR